MAISKNKPDCIKVVDISSYIPNLDEFIKDDKLLEFIEKQLNIKKKVREVYSDAIINFILGRHFPAIDLPLADFFYDMRASGIRYTDNKYDNKQINNFNFLNYLSRGLLTTL